MTTTANPGDYRACPYCAELIRHKAIKCKHCGSEIDPRRVREMGRQGTSSWHLVVLGLLFLSAVGVALLPRIGEHLERRAANEHPYEHLFPEGEEIAAAPEPAPVIAPEPPQPKRPTRRFLNFGEDLEIAVGGTYRGSSVMRILSDNADWAKYEPEGITVGFAGERFLVETAPPLAEGRKRLDHETDYEVVGIYEL